MEEYPKVLHISPGLDVTVRSEAEEARWTPAKPVPAPGSEAAEDVEATHAHDVDAPHAPKGKPKGKHR